MTHVLCCVTENTLGWKSRVWLLCYLCELGQVTESLLASGFPSVKWKSQAQWTLLLLRGIKHWILEALWCMFPFWQCQLVPGLWQAQDLSSKTVRRGRRLISRASDFISTCLLEIGRIQVPALGAAACHLRSFSQGHESFPPGVTIPFLSSGCKPYLSVPLTDSIRVYLNCWILFCWNPYICLTEMRIILEQ